MLSRATGLWPVLMQPQANTLREKKRRLHAKHLQAVSRTSMGPSAVVIFRWRTSTSQRFPARGTRLLLVEQFGLLEGEVLRDLAGDGLPQFASSGFDLGKGGILSSDLLGIQIDAKFLSELLDSLLIAVGPRSLEHAFILELTSCERGPNDALAYRNTGKSPIDISRQPQCRRIVRMHPRPA